MANIVDISDKLMSMGADEVKIHQDVANDTLHVAVFRRPNPGKILRNIKSMLSNRVSRKTRIIVYINPVGDVESENTFVRDSGQTRWVKVPLAPIVGLI